jgi:hypothetical protein
LLSLVDFLLNLALLVFVGPNLSIACLDFLLEVTLVHVSLLLVLIPLRDELLLLPFLFLLLSDFLIKLHLFLLQSGHLLIELPHFLLVKIDLFLCLLDLERGVSKLSVECLDGLLFLYGFCFEFCPLLEQFCLLDVHLVFDVLELPDLFVEFLDLVFHFLDIAFDLLFVFV